MGRFRRRTTDGPKKHPRLWKAGIHVRRNPVIYAFTIAILVAGFALAGVLDSQAEQRHQQVQLKDQNDQLQDQNARLQGQNRRILELSASQATNRAQAIQLLCIQNRVMIGILVQNNASGGAAAVKALTAINCSVILHEAIQQASTANRQAGRYDPIKANP